MATSPLPDIEYLRECFDFDVESGVLRWRIRPRSHFKNEQAYNSWNTKWSSKAAGSECKTNRYRTVGVNWKLYKVHRIVWFLTTGKPPPADIDHKNCDRTNNVFTNLRGATRSQNICNGPKRVNNTSGLKGASWDSNTSKWKAQICINYHKFHLGLFDTPEAAHAAYCEASARLHGEFGRTG